MKKQSNVSVQNVIVVSCVVIFVLLICALIINLIEYAALSSRQKQLYAQLEAIESRIEQNEAEISMREGEEYIDKIAREYLNMRGKDEITFIAK